MINETKGKNFILVGVNEYLADKKVKYTVTDFMDNSIVAQGDVIIQSNGINDLCEILPDGTNHFYFIEWEVDNISYKNHYISGPAPYDFDRYVSYLRRGDLLQIQGF